MVVVAEAALPIAGLLAVQLRVIPRRTLAVVLVAALVGCDGDDGGMGPTVATQLAFTVQPGDATAGASIAPAGVAASERASGAVITAAVAIQDASGNVVTTATNAVTIEIDTNPAGGTLSGTATVNAVNGVANFPDLTIERAGHPGVLSRL